LRTKGHRLLDSSDDADRDPIRRAGRERSIKRYEFETSVRQYSVNLLLNDCGHEYPLIGDSSGQRLKLVKFTIAKGVDSIRGGERARRCRWTSLRLNVSQRWLPPPIGVFATCQVGVNQGSILRLTEASTTYPI